MVSRSQHLWRGESCYQLRELYALGWRGTPSTVSQMIPGVLIQGGELAGLVCWNSMTVLARSWKPGNGKSWFLFGKPCALDGRVTCLVVAQMGSKEIPARMVGLCAKAT